MSSPGPTTSGSISMLSEKPCWIWPFRHPQTTAAVLWRLAGRARWLDAEWKVVVAGCGMGALPLLASFGLGWPGHQLLTASLLFVFFLAYVRDDQQRKAILLIAVVFSAHSALAIYLAAAAPDRAAGLMPNAAAYWRHQLQWIQTGYDPEYDPANWVFNHLQLLLAILLFSFLSLGWVPFFEGLKEVDLMNYYVGQLTTTSQDQIAAIMVGWHLWSILRGIAYTVVIYEVASWSLQRICGRTLSPYPRRQWRWLLGLSFFALDCAVKYATLASVREQLFHNLKQVSGI
jgi:hypothetical protein